MVEQLNASAAASHPAGAADALAALEPDSPKGPDAPARATAHGTTLVSQDERGGHTPRPFALGVDPAQSNRMGENSMSAKQRAAMGRGAASTPGGLYWMRYVLPAFLVYLVFMSIRSSIPCGFRFLRHDRCARFSALPTMCGCSRPCGLPEVWTAFKNTWYSSRSTCSCKTRWASCLRSS
jgi:hypothetical protein